jgi:hypothetical protein
MREDEAIVLENWFPEETTVRVRRGHTEHVTGLGAAVDSLMSWNGPASTKMFGAAGGSIFDVTTAGAVGAADITGLTGNRWQHTMYGNSAGNFLYIVNGEDAPRYYSGTAWTTPSLTGSGLTVTDLIHVNAFKTRLFFIESGSLSFWYLPVESIAGTLTEFDLSSRCKLGGHLVAMGTWTRDGGDGMDDLAVFVTSKGEVIVFQGSDPGSASAWSLIGTFRIGAPIGRRCLVQIGSELVVITEDGFSTLSRFLNSGRASSQAAMSDKISGAVLTAVRSDRTRFGWQPAFFPAGNMVLINVPTSSQSQQFVSNATTGAWCKFTGMDARAWEVHDDKLFFGGGDGTVYRADNGTSDAGSNIETDAKTAFTYLGTRGRMKKVNMARPSLTVDGDIGVVMAVSTDFGDTHPTSTPTFSPFAGSEWDTAEWDLADWSSGSQSAADWLSVVGMGQAVSLRLKTVSSNGEIHWNSVDWLYELGGFV